jgi:hypothetical protein
MILESAFRMFGLKDLLLFQNEEGASLKVFREGKVINWFNKGYYIKKIPNNALVISEKDGSNYIDYVCLSDLTLVQIPFYPNYTDLNIIIDHWDKHTIKEQNLKKSSCWQTDISSYGKYINLRDEQQPNEIDGDLMGYENLLFVPLKGGQLLALNVETGEKVWMLDQEISGQYAIFQDKIYKKNRFLYEIDAQTGTIIRLMDIEDGSISEEFMAIGPIWVYEDVIIIINNYDGDVILLNKDDFKVLGKINVDASIAWSKDSIIWYGNKLYVLDLANTLHIYERE